MLLFASCKPPAKTGAKKENATYEHKSPLPGKKAVTVKRAPRLQVEWDPATGKGAVNHRTASGDWFRTCFHCGYEGYAGGLVIGNYNGSGFGYYPRTPIRGHKRINLFCAQDESIWDRDEAVEYTYGWSENYGKGDDGIVLEYVKGGMPHRADDETVLRSVNAKGCYQVTKVAHTRADVSWWIIATRIENTCDHPIHFDFFSGDDPWLGLYRSSDGDVGWTPDGLVPSEAYLGLGGFQAGGIYDRGNPRLGQSKSSFTNQANVVVLDPVTPLPNRTFFANAFAHSESEIDDSRPLDNKTLTALNLGWTDRTLQPGEGLTVAMALGRADTASFESALPKVPVISDEDWSVWRHYLRETDSPVNGAVLFAAETVDVDIGSQNAVITGTYWLRNTGSTATTVGIRYPIITAEERPPPKQIAVDGKPTKVFATSKTRAESRFSIQVPSFGIKRFEVRYTQAYYKNRVVYMVTSANRWPGPLTRATFTVRVPESFTDVHFSYPSQSKTQKDGKITHRITRQPFAPDRELEVVFKRTR